MNSEGDIPLETEQSEPAPNSVPDDSATINEIEAKFTGSEFEDWYRKKQFADNVRKKQTYFNGPSKFKKPGKFTASDLLKCHRKIYYKNLNAPREEPSPDAIFFYGTRVEEELVEEFITEHITNGDTYLQNDLWVNFSIASDLGDMEINGSTDPVVVKEDGTPVLPTEIKTTSNTEYVSESKEAHKAQAHAYMWGLSKKYNRPVDRVALMYIGRDGQFSPRRFLLNFDSEFWSSRVVSWMEENTYYHTFGILPPDEPERDWECEYCDYRNRCGAADELRGEHAPIGLLPLFEYPRQQVVDYLEAHHEEKLTPALATLYPELAEEYGAYQWECDACGNSYSWERFDWDPNESPPKCPNCRPDSEYLSGPSPEKQANFN